MSPATKASRKSLYKGLNMGGTADWATDLQQYNDPPTRGGILVENWATWKTATKIMRTLGKSEIGRGTGPSFIVLTKLLTTPGMIRLPKPPTVHGTMANTPDTSALNYPYCEEYCNWEVENAIGSQHQLVQYGTCAFGVQGKGKNGNVDFHIGAQDIVDIISDSVRQFGGSGKVGSKGEMSCKGTVKGQTAEGALYHD
ncbi:hypothetical protein GB937_005687 [Aspergillus fischeri]|nr:hypothetical protein GB937_005687 [Aspergillus fischeri]